MTRWSWPRQGGSFGWFVLVLVLVLALQVLVVPDPGSAAVPPQSGGPDVGGAWSVLPPGNGYPFGPTAPHLNDQRAMYDRIDDASADGVLRAASSLATWYKPLTLDVPEPADSRRVETPREGLTITWDEFGVPHVVGSRSTDVAFGAGWVMAEARGLIADISRQVGRSGAMELGTNDLFAALDADVRADWTDEELRTGFDHLVAAAPVEAEAVMAEIDAYLAGFNSWVAAHPLPHRILRLVLGLDDRPWNRADVVAALLTVVGGQSSGGGELENARISRALDARFGPVGGAATYDELRTADAPATPHVDGVWEYPVFDLPGSGVDPASVAMPDPGSVESLPVPTQLPGHSNVVIATAAESAGGHPLLVGGPQNAITSPALLFEVHLSGGGYDSRGALMPGVGPYVIVGRNRTSAWTSTSGESDQTDIRAELLCEPDGSDASPESRHYVFDGDCVPMTRPAGARPGAVWRTRHGPVLRYGSVDGRPVAFSLERSSRGWEVLSALALRRLNMNGVASPADFLDVTEDITFSGNWFWIDADDAAYAHVGRYPIRKAGASTEFPTWGTGEWEWQGVLDPGLQPHAVNPETGILQSWNNKVADGWRTADDDWGNVGPHRVDLLAGPARDAAQGDGDLTLSELVDIHTRAGSTDLRGAGVLPAIIGVLDSGPAPSRRLAQVLETLRDWAEAGAFRRDRNNDWMYDHPGVPLMDAYFERAVKTAFADLDGLWDILRPALDAGPKNDGSSFGYGWYGLLWRDLRRLQGLEPGRAHCGGGDLTACRAALWDALDRAQQEVARAQLPWNATDPPAWTKSTVRERIWFLPYVFNPSSVRWSNRPAYEIAVTFG